jgi:coiled-coil and C2 domain-containing protein 2A
MMFVFYAGSAIPEGTTAYVMTEESDGFYIWNSSTGKRYSVHDNYCPLQSVGCLVNHENVSFLHTIQLVLYQIIYP